MQFVEQYPFLVLIAAAVLLLLAFLIFRPRQRVRLTDSAPVRPHMQAKASAKNVEGRGLAGEAAAAASDVSGEILSAPVHAKLSEGSGPADDLVQIKGVGPKLAETLNALGFTRFEQLAGLSANEIERLDTQLGAFKGRISRDRIVEQADYLSRNDIDGFEQKFGKL